VVRRCWFAAAGALVVLVALVIAATGVKPGQANVDTLRLAAGIMLAATLIRALLVPAVGFAVRTLELVAAGAPGAAAAGGAIAAVLTPGPGDRVAGRAFDPARSAAPARVPQVAVQPFLPGCSRECLLVSIDGYAVHRRPRNPWEFLTSAMRFSRHAWWLYLALMVPVTVAYLAGPLDIGPVFNGIGFSACIAIVVGVRRHKPAASLSWYLIALGQALFVAGDVIAYNYKAFFGTALPFPSVADPLYLAVYPLTVAGLLLIIRRRSPGRDWGSLIDSVIVTIGLGLLSWVFLIAPYAHDTALHLSTKLVSIAYPLGDILIMGVAVRIAVGGGRRGLAYYMMIGAMAALLATDSVYGWILLHGTYTPGDLLDGGWIVYYVLLGAAALHPSMTTVSHATAPKIELTRRRILGIAVAALIAPVTELVKASGGGGSDAIVIGAVAIVLFGLVVVRMIGLARAQEAAAERESVLRESVLRTESEVRLSALVQHSSDVILVLASDSTVEYASPSIHQVLGYEVADFVGRRLLDEIPEEDQALVRPALGGVVSRAAEPSEAFELRIRHRDGRLLHAECLFTNLLTHAAVGGIVVNLRDITERKRFEEQLTYQAFHDSVTDLANRALFRDRVEHALKRRGEASRPLAVLFLDLDDFKIINDTFGHDAGDRLLQTISARLRSTLRASDTVARLGGDEFAVLLEDITNETEASEIVTQLLEIIRTPLWLDDREATVQCSIGIAVARPSGQTGAAATVDELLRNADAAMYQAKAAGGNMFRHFKPAMHETVVKQLALRTDLKAAIAADELTLAYQPIFVVGTGEITGYEALLRWEHAVRGTVAPATFIPAAEESGLIIPLGRWALERACADAVAFQRDDQHAQGRVLSVNISARQLQRVEIVDEVRSALRSSGLDPHCLMLEITESLMISDVALAIERLSALRELGVRVAIDDFGTGYSSLNYILQLPIDVLKIDKRFIDSVDGDDKESRLTAAIISLARALDLRCIAEGVERTAQHERLQELGCDYAQGFLLARPMTCEALHTHLTDIATPLATVG
jgi:diguanylate cyclase (GGDEF)-like protein/PAS domain S-box-containing protein